MGSGLSGREIETGAPAWTVVVRAAVAAPALGALSGDLRRRAVPLRLAVAAPSMLHLGLAPHPVCAEAAPRCIKRLLGRYPLVARAERPAADSAGIGSMTSG